jgi:3-phosphoshikimate 1-carboxyvinyltransferase
VSSFGPSGPLKGTLRPPPDKSISHRAAIVAAMGEGETEVRGFLRAADTKSTMQAIQGLGGNLIYSDGEDESSLDLVVEGFGLRGPGERGTSPASINVGNAGTLLRILPGWLAGQEGGVWELDGDESIRRRPVDRIVEPLAEMGAKISCRDGRLTPVSIEGRALHAIDYRLPVASAQVKSCLLLAGLLAEGETSVTEPAPTRDHTERMLISAGAEVATEELRTVAGVGGPPARRISVKPVERLESGSIEVPGDFSSAAFALVAAVLVPGSELRIEGVGLNPTRVGLLGILNRMGAPVAVEEGLAAGYEARGAIAARNGPLEATHVSAAEVPLAIDELPLVALLGCFAEGTTLVSGAEELRHKESDRIATVVEGLRGLGAEIEATDDGFAVTGTGGLRGGTLDAHGDHRLAMLGAVAGLASREGVDVLGVEAAAISYPGFEADLASLKSS